MGTPDHHQGRLYPTTQPIAVVIADGWGMEKCQACSLSGSGKSACQVEGVRNGEEIGEVVVKGDSHSCLSEENTKGLRAHIEGK